MQILTATRLLLSLNHWTSNHQRDIGSLPSCSWLLIGSIQSQGAKLKDFQMFVSPPFEQCQSLEQLDMAILDIPMSFPGENFLKSWISESQEIQLYIYRWAGARSVLSSQEDQPVVQGMIYWVTEWLDHGKLNPNMFRTEESRAVVNEAITQHPLKLGHWLKKPHS